MAKTRARKEKDIQEFVENVSQSKATVFVRYSGLPVKKEQELRSELRKAGNRYAVTKKTLLKLSLKELGVSIEDLGDTSGSIAVAFGSEDEVSVAKSLYAFAKESKGFELIGGYYNGSVISKAEVEQLATLPSHEELLAKVVYLIGSPLRGLVQVLNGPNRNFVQVLKAVQEQKQ